MSIAESIVDYCPEITITNTDSLPAGTGCQYLLVIESPYAYQYIAKRWLRKLPQSVKRTERIVRFGAVPAL